MNMFLQVYKVILKGFIFINELSKPFQQLESITFYDDKRPGIIMTTLTARKCMLTKILCGGKGTKVKSWGFYS